MKYQKISLILFISVIGIFLASSTSAATINVDTSWMADGYPTLINNIMDGDPETLGKDGQTDAQYGDTISFTAGRYQLPMDYGNWFKLYIDGVTIQGDLNYDWGTEEPITIFRGASPNSGGVWESFASNLTFTDFITENSFAGPVVKGDNYENILFQFIRSKGHRKHFVWKKQDRLIDTTTPDVFMRNVYIEGGEVGFHYDSQGQGANMKTKYLGGEHITAANLTGLVIDAPLADNNGTPVFKGDDDFNDSIIIGGTSFREDLYGGMNSPNGFVEWSIDVASLESRGIGMYNVEAYPKLNDHGRPLPGSIAIGSQYKDGYSGAIPPRKRIRFRTSAKKVIPISVSKIDGHIIVLLDSFI